MLLYVHEFKYLRKALIKTLGYIKTQAPNVGPGVPPVCKSKENTQMFWTGSIPGPGLGTSALEVLCTV